MGIIKSTSDRKFPLVVLIILEEYLTKDDALSGVLFEHEDLGYPVLFKDVQESPSELERYIKSELVKASSVLANKNSCLVIVKCSNAEEANINFLAKEKDSVFSAATIDCANIRTPFKHQFLNDINWSGTLENRSHLVELVLPKRLLSAPDPIFVGRNTFQVTLQTIIYGISGILTV